MTQRPLNPSPDAFAELAQQGNLIPVFVELTADYETPLSAFRKIDDGRTSFLFESAETTQQAGRYSFLGSEPQAVFTARGREVTVVDSAGGSTTKTVDDDPLHELERLMDTFKPVPRPELPVFNGGAVGYLAYDMVRFFEPTIGEAPEDQLGLPDMVFFVTDTVLIFDHRFRKIQVVANIDVSAYVSVDEAYAVARGKIEGIIAKLETAVPQPTLHSFPVAGDEVPDLGEASNTTQEEYEKFVRDSKEYIGSGDIFQVVPSQRFEVDYTGTPIELYRALRHVNPSPYMFCLQFPDGFSLVGSSPEVHVRCIDGRVDIRPIAGTRWRGKTEAEDDALADDLLGDPKERAEHIMLVDLARNDVGRVANHGSVVVDDLMIIERYSHVMHIVSNVHGQLADGRSSYDVMRATFPAGTVSGSPKVRAMQVINELEKSKRCAYAGAVGYFGFDGNHDSCIALRTCVLKDGKAYVQAGAGVVADSDPTYEYEETCNKAQGMLRAIARAKTLSE